MLKFLFSLLPAAGAAIAFPRLALPFLIYSFIVSLFTFFSYGSDKFFAIMHWRRIPEDFLIVLGFFGGVPGAFAGMKIFHHKTLKLKFKVVPLLLVMQIAAAGYGLYKFITLYY